MPGPVSMANNVPASSPKKAMNPTPAPEKPPLDSFLPNGVDFQPPALPRQTESGMRSSLQDLPPELQHWTEDYQPLGKLFGRAAQEAYNGLIALLKDLAKLPEVPQVNGSQAHTELPVISKAASQRRLRWLNFAEDQRTRFIKLKIISEWSQRIGEIEKLVDLNLWINEQEGHLAKASYQLGEVRRNLAEARFASPDIETALEVLQTGALAKTSDLNYIPPEPLPAEKVLKTLENLNLLLHVRLNLHEDLPAPFQDYRIKSGKVTFTVISEFELDLSIGDEDPSSQFWFVDFRLLVSGAPESLAPQLRNTIEQHVNAVLSQEGLSGCFNLLHEFTLTHKIHALRKQAIALSRGAWSGNIKIEQHHRNLVVQYWSARPRRKSWIQVGVAKGKDTTRDLYGAQSVASKLFVKCVQNGKEDAQCGFDVSQGDLDMEQILLKAIQQHAEGMLKTLKSRYTSPQAVNEAPRFPSENLFLDEAERALSLPIVPQHNASVALEPVTGNFLLTPVTSTSEHYQKMLNTYRENIEDPFNVVERWRTAEIQRHCETLAENIGLQVLPTTGLPFDAIKKEFGSSVVRASFFHKASWSPTEWFACCTVYPSAQAWWVARLAETEQGYEVVAHEPLPVNLTDYFWRPQYPQIPLKDLERFVPTTISLNVLKTFLREKNIEYASEDRIFRSARESAVVKFNASALLTRTSQSSTGSESRATALAEPQVDLVINGFVEPTDPDVEPLIQYVVKGHLDHRKVKPGLLNRLQGQDLVVDALGRFALRLQAPLGSSDVLVQLARRLHSLQRLSSFLIMLGKHKLSSRDITETQVSFQYSTSPDLVAQVNFLSKSVNNVSLALGPDGENPQARILGALVKALNKADDNDLERVFDNFLNMLSSTLPLLQFLDKLESSDRAVGRVQVHTRSASTYHLVYNRFGRTFSIEHTSRHKSPSWAIVQAPESKRQDTPGQTEVQNRIASLFTKSGDAWYGRHDGIVAEHKGISAALEELDKTMQDCEPLIAAERPPTAKAEPTANPQPNGVRPQIQAPSNNQARPNGQAAKGPASALKKPQQANPQSNAANGSNAKQKNVVVLD